MVAEFQELKTTSAKWIERLQEYKFDITPRGANRHYRKVSKNASIAEKSS